MQALRRSLHSSLLRQADISGKGAPAIGAAWSSLRKYASTPADTKMTVREGLNSALDEEMAYDDKVFIIGEEVGEYQGAYKITKGLLQKYGPERVRDTPITEVRKWIIALSKME